MIRWEKEERKMKSKKGERSDVGRRKRRGVERGKSLRERRRKGR